MILEYDVLDLYVCVVINFSGQQQFNELLAKTSSGSVKLRQCENYRQKLCTDLADRAARIQRHATQYNDVAAELMRLRRQHISDLITYIFPISELPAKRYLALILLLILLGLKHTLH